MFNIGFSPFFQTQPQEVPTFTWPQPPQDNTPEEYPGQHHQQQCSHYWELMEKNPAAADAWLKMNHISKESMYLIA